MQILITNDDGIRAPGIRALAEVAAEFGDVMIVAPDRERSACSHALTLREPLRDKRIEGFNCPAHELNGWPSDCVNYGKQILLDGQVDLVLSGFNNGPNLGFDVTYSGTVGGAMEGAINDVFSIALSMALFVDDAPPHFATGARWLRENLGEILRWPRKPLTFLNINIPAITFEEIKGAQIAGMGKRVYQDRMEQRSDPWGRPYVWQGGVVAMQNPEPGTDVEAVANGFVSITPVSLDWTDQAHATNLRALLGRDRVSAAP